MLFVKFKDLRVCDRFDPTSSLAVKQYLFVTEHAARGKFAQIVLHLLGFGHVAPLGARGRHFSLLGHFKARLLYDEARPNKVELFGFAA